jgi:hypothetical protein
MFRKSSLCKADSPMCVEVEVEFRRASECSYGDCVEAEVYPSMVRVRNSTRPGRIISFTAEEWRTFIAAVKKGEFDVPTEEEA